MCRRRTLVLWYLTRSRSDLYWDLDLGKSEGIFDFDNI